MSIRKLLSIGVLLLLLAGCSSDDDSDAVNPSSLIGEWSASHQSKNPKYADTADMWPFTFNPDGEIVGIEVTKLEEPQPEMVYTVVGPAHVFGTEWDPTDVNNDMVLDPETNLYTWTKQGVQLDDFFGFKVVGNHSWDYEWPIGYENNWNAYLPDGAGVYDIVITYDPAQPEEKITCTLTK